MEFPLCLVEIFANAYLWSLKGPEAECWYTMKNCGIRIPYTRGHVICIPVYTVYMYQNVYHKVEPFKLNSLRKFHKIHPFNTFTAEYIHVCKMNYPYLSRYTYMYVISVKF